VCGRAGYYSDKNFLHDANTHHEVKNFIGELKPSYNIALTQNIAVLFNTYDYKYASFGLIPSWAKDTKFKAINARSETLSEKPSFRESIKTKRCIVPLNGYFEWQSFGKEKQPYWIAPKDKDYFSVAGIYDEWQDKQTGSIVTGVSIITKSAHEEISFIHDRMPVMLENKDWDVWLDRDMHSIHSLEKFFEPSRDLNAHYHKVGSSVGKVQNNSASLIVPSHLF
jgi:putative SOS response-associated peptidase YedK